MVKTQYKHLLFKTVVPEKNSILIWVSAARNSLQLNFRVWLY